MDTKTAWQTLRDYAEGRIDHAWAERCPNTEYGHDIRDSDCPVCQALDAVQGCLAQIEEPALEAPAHQCCNSWFLSLPEGRQAVLRDDKWMLADAAYQAGRESRSALEAPAAPALSIGPKLARIMGYREHYRTWGRQLSDATELVESHPSHWRIVGEAMDELADALAAAPQAPAAPSAYSADLLAALGQWHQRCEVMGAHHTLTEAQIAELVVAGLLRRAHGGQVITTAGRAALAAPAAPAVDVLSPERMREEFIAWAEVAYRHEEDFSKRDFEICLKAWRFGSANALLAAQAAAKGATDQ